MLRIAEQVCHLGVRVDEVQKARIVAAAGREGVSVSEWVRWACEAVLEAESAPVNVFVQAHNRRQR